MCAPSIRRARSMRRSTWSSSGASSPASAATRRPTSSRANACASSTGAARGCCRGSSICTRTCASPAPRARRTWRSGLRAAAAGGFVDVCCMPNTRPVNDSRVVTEMLVAKARAIGTARLHPIGAITVGQQGEQLDRDGRPEGRRRRRRQRRRALRDQQPGHAARPRVRARRSTFPSSSTPRTTR